MYFHEEDNDIIRSSRSQMFFKIGVLKHFAIFTGKQSCRPEASYTDLKNSYTGVFL